jgi:hypothetical protein
VHALEFAFSTAVQFQDAVSINMDTVVNGVSLRMPIVIYFGRLVSPCQISCLVSDVFISGKRMHVVSDMIVIMNHGSMTYVVVQAGEKVRRKPG